jgi:2-dehydro-3-deoxy-D-arabinonate dehydratase
MTPALFRVALPGDHPALARGTIEDGPVELLAPPLTLGALLARGDDALARAVESGPVSGPVPSGARILAPVDEQEVWASGVTYERSRDARMEESAEPTIYDRIYDADRPELFPKAAGWRVRGPGESVAVRADSTWDAPEPELALVISADLAVVGYTIANDVTSRSIEGDNPLYLPQAKVYDHSCALGPAIVPVGVVEPPFPVRMVVRRAGSVVVNGETSTERLRRGSEDLARHLGRALSFPHGVVLLTGTGVVPDPPFTLMPGDVVRIELGPLGVLENPVVRVG